MKALLLTLFFPMLAGASIGEPVRLVKENDRERLSVQYGVEESSASLHLTGSFITESLPKGRPFYARFWDGKNNRFTSEWQEVNLPPEAGAEELLAIKLEDQSAASTIEALPFMVLVFSSDKLQLESSLEIRALCKTTRAIFDNMISGGKGCGSVSKAK